jgi:hypothetical protein
VDGTLTDESKVKLLSNELVNPPWTTASMVLSTYNAAIDHTTTAAALLAGELTVSGYTRQPLYGWSTPTLDSTFRAVAQANAVTFANSSGAPTPTVYSWAFLDTASNKLIVAGLFDLPFSIPAGGGTFVTVPFARTTGG